MADSDPDYSLQVGSDDDADHDVGSRGGSSRAKGKGRAAGQRRKEKWESSIKEFGTLIEGEDGTISGSLLLDGEARKRKRLRPDTKPYQRGIIRHVILIMDLSEAMNEKDMQPTRYAVVWKYTQDYVREFFEQNPISQMSVMAMHDGVCIRLSELSGNPNDHIQAIERVRYPPPGKVAREPKGSPSLQNALELSRAALYHTPSHGTREVIIVLGALLSLDPGDIHQTIRSCVKDRIRVSIIGMAGRLRICSEICSRTNGGDESSYTVALDQYHLRDLIMATTTPPVIRSATSANEPATPASLLMMGFPSRAIESAPSLCACHGQLTRGGYTCSRCKAKVCSLPVTCPSCHLTLILSTHLARSYHHLFPLQHWAEVSWARARQTGSTQCRACLSPFPPIPDKLPSPSTSRTRQSRNGEIPNGFDFERGNAGLSGDASLPAEPRPQSKPDGASESSRYECQACGNHFCVDCDLFCHEVAHNCPGCLSQPPSQSNGQPEAMDTGP